MKTITLIILFISFNYIVKSQEINADSLHLNSSGNISCEIISLNNNNYTKTIKWINSTFLNPEKVIQGKVENKTIHINGYSDNVMSGYGMSYSIYFTFNDQGIKYNFILNEMRNGASSVPASFFYKKDGLAKPSAAPAIIDIEKAINSLLFSYIKTLNDKTLTSAEALEQLKAAKDKLDLQIITQEEYNKILNELKIYIKE